MVAEVDSAEVDSAEVDSAEAEPVVLAEAAELAVPEPAVETAGSVELEALLPAVAAVAMVLALVPGAPEPVAQGAVRRLEDPRPPAALRYRHPQK